MSSKTLRRRAALFITLSSVTALVGCATPQERCIRDATRELSTVNMLIAETQANIDRGYAILVETVPYTVYETCYFGVNRSYSCPRTYTKTVRTPTTIIESQERKKLADLQKRVPALEKESGTRIAQCQALHAE
jgi:hypothetical protein